MADFWSSCGYNLLRKGADGRLIVTDDYLRLYYARPELAPVAESCANERALHALLLAQHAAPCRRPKLRRWLTPMPARTTGSCWASVTG